MREKSEQKVDPRGAPRWKTRLYHEPRQSYVGQSGSWRSGLGLKQREQPKSSESEKFVKGIERQ